MSLHKEGEELAKEDCEEVEKNKKLKQPAEKTIKSKHDILLGMRGIQK